MYLLVPSRYVNILYEKISEEVINYDKVIARCSILPNDSGIVVRILANMIDNIKEVTHYILKICRQEILGADFSGIRKN
jgi:urease accessory protein